MARRKQGAGGLRQRSDGRWEGRAVIGYDEKGLPKTKNVLAKTKTECEKKLAELLAEIGPEPTLQPKREPHERTLGEWMDEWYQTYIKPNLRPGTQGGYEYSIYQQIAPKVGDTPLCKFTHNDAQRFYGELKQNGRLSRTDIFREVSGFDERFFIYYEDMDITRRAAQKKRALYYPYTYVYHCWERASSHKPKYFVILVEGMFKYFGKWGWKFK